MSFSGSGSIPYEFSLEVLSSYGVALVAGAGNDGDNEVDLPARVDEVIAVGATVGNSTQRYPEANYGSDLDVAASWYAVALDRDLAQPPYIFEGTSAATPVISGVMALYRSVSLDELYYPRLWTDHDCDHFAFGHPGWNQFTGCGKPDVHELLWRSACWIYDVAPSGHINVSDNQVIAFRYGAFLGSAWYHPHFDVEPIEPDGDIDIKDLQKVFGRNGMHCPSYTLPPAYSPED